MVNIPNKQIDFTKPLDHQLVTPSMDDADVKRWTRMGKGFELAAMIQHLADDGVDATLPKWREFVLENPEYALERRNAVIGFVKQHLMNKEPE